MTDWTTTWLIAEEAVETARKGGLFDFDLTLPLMAAQFLLLIALLNAVFYKPVTQMLDERAEYIRNNLADARTSQEQAQALARQFDDELKDARRQSQETIAAAQQAAQKIAAERAATALQEVTAEREQAAREIAEQKQAALQELEGQVSDLSAQILEKLVGPELARR
ncbi:ATP synthase, F0 subunit b [Rubidibacter lacunae KORDI 51-2]|uniref:ATP synthase subunit b' n=1 Tax=Rubidibacter lacunae KORDI 51-2 TaxID=582515 RepID=U5DQ57_9CHRO|nr:F0F1 ATP synthase subunit B' [Rubidibacter lacunae]ERN41830.1 ATP synthase, F0 subunit b [Rubidibacter lacunae KORDI 51-2]